MKRTRRRVIPGLQGNFPDFHEVWHYPDGDPPYPEWTPIGAGGLFRHPPEQISYMTDLTMDDPLYAHLASKPCFHRRVDQYFNGDIIGKPTGMTFGDNPWYCLAHEQSSGNGYATPSVSLVAQAAQVLPTVRQLEFDYKSILSERLGYPGWTQVGWRKPKVTLTSDFNLVNFLLELGESFRLAQSWLLKKALLKRYHALLGANDGLKATARAAANERLAHVYGTQLFLRDARRMFQLFVGWKHYADVFISNSGLLKRVYKDSPPHVEFSLPPINAGLPRFDVANSYVTLTQTVMAECHATLYYYYTVPEIRGWLSRLGQFCDTFGVKIDLGVAWDAIPLTFVVDWFINVSEWLHANFSREWTTIDLVLADFAISGKVVWNKNLVWNRD
jgi:hypothetical protein